MKCFTLFGLAFCFIMSTAFGADIYVSPAGNDAAAGTQDAPLATIAAARDKADGVKASGPVTVHLMAGTYYLKAPVIFGTANSGSASAPITYKGEGKAVISGGILVTTSWSSTTLNGATVQTTKLAANLHVDQLFVNGKRQILARYPNYNYNTKILNGSASDAQSKGSAGANPAEGPGYLRGIHSSGWGGNSYYFTGKTTTQWVGDNNRGSGMNGNQMVENIYELLDAQGEWFYRKSTGDLWFYPPAGTNLSTATVELASISQLVRFVGTSGTSANSVKYITFDNVVFTHTYRSLFDSTGQFYELVTASDWGIVRKGAVFMQNAEDIHIQNCLFDHVGGNGVFMSGYNDHNVVYNCAFTGTGANCVAIFGLRSSIRCPNAWPNKSSSSCSDRTPGPLTQDYPRRCVVNNCLMDTLGIFEKQVSGCAFSATEFDTIRHNSIGHMPRAGINFCDGCWGGTLVEYNWVYDVVRETSDHGPFNAWGRDRNAIYGSNDAAATYYDARNPTMVRMNRFEVPGGMFGIDLDDQASNYYQEKNLVLGGGFKVQWTRGNKYINNISTATNNGNVQFHGTWGSASQPSYHYGARNIIYATSTCVYQFCCGSNPSQVAGTQTKWDSNMVYSPAGTPKCSDWNNCNGGNYTWQQWTGAGLDAHSVVANPNFTSTTKTWPGRTPEYKPVGDYTPTNTTALTTLKFQPFPMDSFGIVGTVPGPAYGTSKVLHPAEHETAEFKPLAVQYRSGRLTISLEGAYDAVITTVSGRTLARFEGRGRSSFALNAKRFGCGTYLLVVNTKNGVVSRRFIMNN
jgi:hypothetical protein